MLCSLKSSDRTIYQTFIEYENDDGSISDSPPEVNLFSLSTESNQCLPIKLMVLAFRKQSNNGGFSKLVLRIKSISEGIVQSSKNFSVNQKGYESGIKLSLIKYELYQMQAFVNVK